MQMVQKQIVQSGATIETFKYERTMMKGFPKSIDDSNDDIIYKAIQSLKEVYLKYLND